MAIKTKNGYKCGYCGKLYTGQNGITDADKCKESHNLIYVALSPEDLNRLLMFIYSKDDRVLSESIVDRLQSYLKGAFQMELWDKSITTSKELK